MQCLSPKAVPAKILNPKVSGSRVFPLAFQHPKALRPCGMCHPCKERERIRNVHRVQDAVRGLETALLTLTFENEHLPMSADIEAGELSEAQAKLLARIEKRSQGFNHRSDADVELMDIMYGHNVPQAEVRKKELAKFWRCMRDRFRERGVDGPEWVVSCTEYGDKFGRPHAHAIVAAPMGSPMWIDFEAHVRAAWPYGIRDCQIGRRGKNGALEGYLLKDFMKNRVVKDRYIAEGREPPSTVWPHHESIGKAVQIAAILPVVCQVAKYFSPVQFETLLQRGFWDSMTERTPRADKFVSTTEGDKSKKSTRMFSRATCESLRAKLYDYGLRTEERTEGVRDLVHAEAVLYRAFVEPGPYHSPSKAKAHEALIDKSRAKSERVKKNHEGILRRKGKIR